MDLNELKKLKSGTDVRGVAVGENVTLTDEAVSEIVKAFSLWLSLKLRKTELKIAVGNDSRISAPRLVHTVVSSLIACGTDVVYTGLSSTPSMFILLKESDWGCDASIMITASHLPYDRNGLKFFTPEGGLASKDIDEILFLAAEGSFKVGGGRYFEQSFMDDYSRILVEKVQHVCGFEPLNGKKIIVDAGNGAGGFFAEKVLAPLGADTSGSLYLEPDGLFPNHVPNPEDRQAIECLSRAVIQEKADLGIIFDTDVDRAACVDKGGEEINRNLLIALISAIILPERGGVIVTDSVTSPHLTEFIESLGGEHLRFKRGYKNVIDKCRELNENGRYSPLAIETSGHAAFPENYYLDDGAYLITRILICLSAQSKKGESLKELIAGLKRPVREAEVRIGFSAKSVDFKVEGKRVIDDLKKIAADVGFSLSPDNYEGVRMHTGECCVLVRMSVHDPVMPINFESDNENGVKAAAQKLYHLMDRYEFLDLSSLTAYISNN